MTDVDELSPFRRYAFALWRRYESSRQEHFIMFNRSTVDESPGDSLPIMGDHFQTPHPPNARPRQSVALR
jgi:hypothetical protein